ncbi:latent-transforming growth factor beta-binding protein 4 isoform X3 [Apteryx mantelli]|uniref:Latent-transforming growth factor beta-binding protein 4 isoform X3 n=1 Tax=Apteryx mantelli TaxID=2696672 RepID=A0ABM4G002_9AVES
MSSLLARHLESHGRRGRGPPRAQSPTARPPRGQHQPRTPVLCPLMCRNGGVCTQRDACLCPPDFTGKFCHIPANRTQRAGPPPAGPQPQSLTKSVYTLPLANHREERDGALSMVSVHVQHPPEASVTIHQVERVRGPRAEEEEEEAAAPNALPGPRSALYSVLAQSSPRVPGYGESAGYGYCFRQLRDGECSLPLPGLRTQEICCRGAGVAWGVHECQPCDAETANLPAQGQQDAPCPKGFQRSNGSCVDVDECQDGGFCQNGLCTNTRGSFACLCHSGYILDSSRSSCISHQVISEAKGPCYRVLRDGHCALPTLRNITKQICCCSRVGKAWGHGCERCPPFGSEGFKEICPAGPGYHYSASDLRYNTRYLGHDLPRVPVGRPRGPTAAPPATPRWRGPPPGPEERRPGRLPPTRPPPVPEVFVVPRPTPAPARPVPTLAPREVPVPAPGGTVCERNPQICGPGRCVPRQGGYTCLCHPGFWLSTQGTHCIDVDECRRSPRPCTNGRCENSVGSYHCACAPGYRADAAGTDCQDVDECTQQPCAGGRCENTPGSYRCVCPAGYQLGPPGTGCADIDECAQSPRPCAPGRCENTPGSYRCACPRGYQAGPDGTQCVDVDECQQSPRPCAPGRCENAPGSYRCACPRGYQAGPDGTQCIDVDECQQSPRPCAPGRCENAPGSYRCTCPRGYQPSPDGTQCVDVDECQQSPRPCAYGRCENLPGSYSCSCPAGFQVNAQKTQCEDIDECENHLACPGQECVNTPGSFQCRPCREGYQLRDGRCADVNECLEGDFCFPHGECLNTEGSYSCLCAQGYSTTADGTACTDVDECQRGGVCEGGRCANTDGSFDCYCPAGFRTDADKALCQDVDECREYGTVLCGAQRCENIPGSYRCVTDCQPGYRASASGDCVDVDECREYGAACGAQRCENLPGSYRCVTDCQPGYRAGAGGDCVDVDECANGTLCGDHAVCHNLPGSFQCVCDQGYETAHDGRHCQDVNECETLAGVCGAELCENVEGSFLCLCPDSRDEFDPMTGRCIRPPGAGHPAHGAGPGPGAGMAAVVPATAAPRPPAQPRAGAAACFSKACGVLAANVTQQQCCCSVGWSWGRRCPAQPCPAPGTGEYHAICPHGMGQTSSGPQGLPADVDECTVFGPQLCKGGMCVNAAAGFSCYCPSGYYYEQEHLQCIDNDECLDEEAEPCIGGRCTNTIGSYYCSCDPPLVLDGSQRRCVSNDSQALDANQAVCWQEVGPDLVCGRPRLDRQVTYTECCCLYGEAWGMDCALCPARDSDDFEFLCNVLRPPSYGPARPGLGSSYEYGPEFAPPYGLPYGPEVFAGTAPRAPPPGLRPDYDPYGLGAAGGYDPRGGSLYGPPRYEAADFEDFEEPRGPYRRPGAPRSYRPRSPPSGPRYEPEDPQPGPPWPYQPRDTGTFPERPGRASEDDRYEQFEGLQAEECGVLNGCENGRCVRVPEGYTCDCDQGYRLDTARLACVDVNECAEAASSPTLCLHGRCLNTEGSFRCLCPRGYVLAEPPHRCVPARPRA